MIKIVKNKSAEVEARFVVNAGPAGFKVQEGNLVNIAGLIFLDSSRILDINEAIWNIKKFLEAAKEKGLYRVFLHSPKISLKYLVMLAIIDIKEKEIEIEVILSAEDSKRFFLIKEKLMKLIHLKKEGSLFDNYNLFGEIERAIVPFICKEERNVLTGKKIVIIDLHNFLYRHFYASYASGESFTSQGVPNNALRRLKDLLFGLNQERPDYILFANEGEGSLRKDYYSNYKANREAPPSNLRVQIKKAIKLLTQMGFNVVSENGFEADDIIGAYSKIFSDLGAEVEIYTTDKDMYQLISDKVTIWNPQKKIKINRDICFDILGVYPEQVVNYLALIGDTADNIPGVKGIGPKKASSLLQGYKDLKGIYANLEAIKGKTKEYLAENKNKAIASYILANIYEVILEDYDFEKFAFPRYNFWDYIEDRELLGL